MPPVSLRTVHWICALLTIALAGILASAQSPFANSSFDFGNFRQYEGKLSLTPYPALRTANGTFPLVASGKFGAERYLPAPEGANILLRGSEIHRTSTTMLELEPDSVRSQPQPLPTLTQAAEPLGMFTFSGEIVDSKCFLGVMNPANGRVHRECAIRCISGGVPPLFVVRDGLGNNHFLWLTTESGERPSRAILDYIAEPVQISGRLVRRANLLYFEMTVGSIRRE